MKHTRHTKIIFDVWKNTKRDLKKQIEALEPDGSLSSAFEGTELKKVQLLNQKGRTKLLGDLKDLFEFSLTRIFKPIQAHN